MALKSASDTGTIISTWDSYEEYADYVQATCVRKGLFRSRTSRSLLERISAAQKSAQTMILAARQLGELGYDGDRGVPGTASDAVSVPAEAKGICIDLCHHGEELLMYGKGLAKTREADDFLHEKEIIEHWDRY